MDGAECLCAVVKQVGNGGNPGPGGWPPLCGALCHRPWKKKQLSSWIETDIWTGQKGTGRRRRTAGNALYQPAQATNATWRKGVARALTEAGSQAEGSELWHTPFGALKTYVTSMAGLEVDVHRERLAR